MQPNFHLYDQLSTTHRQELEHEAELYRLLAHLPRHHPTVVQLAVGRFGTLLVVLGTRLKQAEQQGEPAMS
jgi:hypothetical protein